MALCDCTGPMPMKLALQVGELRVQAQWKRDKIGFIVGVMHIELWEHGRRRNLAKENFKGKGGI